MTHVKPYHVEIREDGTWDYYVNGELVDDFDYRQAVTAAAHEERQARDRERNERYDRPLGVYIEKTFAGDGVRHPQLATSPWDHSPSSKFTSFRDLDAKAARLGMVGNRTRD